ncbi:MAG: tRNA 4-thiouridine(8) synthase ThiI [Clostridia bacterium]|nr:tRNA 4-thiouridine(8) synthase ThiI [Clostridia bacterium]
MIKNEIILAKIGEVVLKGLNRKNFEDLLIKNIRRRLYPLGAFEVKASQSTIRITPLDEDIDMDEACSRVGKTFGIVAYCRACAVEKDLEKIKQAACEYLEDELLLAKSFKVESKRSDKKFPYGSPEISKEVGGFIADTFPNLTVDVHNPDITVMVEVRDMAAYVHANAVEGAGGLPIPSGGRAAVLISGGIDSPVAAYMMAKRGIELTAIHFASPPYTSERAEEKVQTLLKLVSEYAGRIEMYTVPFTKIQEEIKSKCPEDLFTIIMRRMMMRVSKKIAEQHECMALITGESLGQVASQTLGAIACTDEVAGMPVFRPLIGMDKKEIIAISEKINTFETSLLPYEDCCTVFTPRHPRTKPKIEMVRKAESAVLWDELIEEAANGAKCTVIYPADSVR